MRHVLLSVDAAMWAIMHGLKSKTFDWGLFTNTLKAFWGIRYVCALEKVKQPVGIHLGTEMSQVFFEKKQKNQKNGTGEKTDLKGEWWDYGIL